MLVLSRNEGERIVINSDIHVKVIAIRGRQVKLGVDAPREIPVRRQSAANRIAEQLELGGEG